MIGKASLDGDFKCQPNPYHRTNCNDANAIPTCSRYAGTYATAIAGRYGWEGLGGQGMGCKWLAGLVSRVCVYVDWRGWEVWGWVANG